MQANTRRARENSDWSSEDAKSELDADRRFLEFMIALENSQQLIYLTETLTLGMVERYDELLSK